MIDCVALYISLAACSLMGCIAVRRVLCTENPSGTAHHSTEAPSPSCDQHRQQMYVLEGAHGMRVHCADSQ